MTYLLFSVPFLAVAAVIAVVAARRLHGAALLAAAAVLVLLTAVFDNVMIAAGLFHYAEEHLAGPLVVRAPIEDFAYPIAGVLLLPALWTLLRRRRSTDARSAR